MSTISKYSCKHPLVTFQPDVLLVGKDGKFAVHSFVLRLHSGLLNALFLSVPETDMMSVILPDHTVEDIVTLSRVIYGVDHEGFVSEGLLTCLDLLEFGTILVSLDEGNQIEMVTFGGSFADVAVNYIIDDIIDNIFDANKGMDSSVPEATELRTYAGSGSNNSNQDTHLKNIKFPCKDCGKLFKTKKTLKSHIMLKHNEDPEFVQKAKDIASKKSLNRECLICNQLFNSRTIDKHLRTEHPEQEPGEETCTYCNKVFSNMSHLTRHVTDVHNDERNFKCPLCDFRPKRAEHLKTHMKCHSADKPHHCNICGYKTDRFRKMKGHMCKPKTFQCPICEFKGVSQDSVRKHKKGNFRNTNLRLNFQLFFVAFLFKSNQFNTLIGIGICLFKPLN